MDYNIIYGFFNSNSFSNNDVNKEKRNKEWFEEFIEKDC